MEKAKDGSLIRGNPRSIYSVSAFRSVARLAIGCLPDALRSHFGLTAKSELILARRCLFWAKNGKDPSHRCVLKIGHSLRLGCYVALLTS